MLGVPVLNQFLSLSLSLFLSPIKPFPTLNLIIAIVLDSSFRTPFIQFICSYIHLDLDSEATGIKELDRLGLESTEYMCLVTCLA